ncbi:hypothetical protein ACFVUS_37710 [Nocardia sp. NPDC058058]|uniref:hypothetical protein n=1 Tax=Nocardia sp. NPDC058058 TaxID=3346317 RepID=UPI0036DD4E85
MTGISDPRQRSSVTEIMEELSDFHYLLGRTAVARMEVDAVLESLFGLEPIVRESIPLIGTGFGRAFGMRGGLLFQNKDGSDATPALEKSLGQTAFAAKAELLNRMLERAMLAGPADHDMPALIQDGYSPQKAWAAAKGSADQEQQQARRLDQEPRWRKGRLRDVIATRELALELMDLLTQATAHNNITIEQMLDGDQQRFRSLADGMPSTRVAISLKVAYHRNPAHVWTVNDIHDIDALTVAVPYCDAVYTDKAVRRAIMISRELKVFTTFLPRVPLELVDWLGRLPQPDD